MRVNSRQFYREVQLDYTIETVNVSRYLIRSVVNWRRGYGSAFKNVMKSFRNCIGIVSSLQNTVTPGCTRAYHTYIYQGPAMVTRKRYLSLKIFKKLFFFPIRARAWYKEVDNIWSVLSVNTVLYALRVIVRPRSFAFEVQCSNNPFCRLPGKLADRPNPFVIIFGLYRIGSRLLTATSVHRRRISASPLM